MCASGAHGAAWMCLADALRCVSKCSMLRMRSCAAVILAQACRCAHLLVLLSVASNPSSSAPARCCPRCLASGLLGHSMRLYMRSVGRPFLDSRLCRLRARRRRARTTGSFRFDSHGRGRYSGCLLFNAGLVRCLDQAQASPRPGGDLRQIVAEKARCLLGQLCLPTPWF